VSSNSTKKKTKGVFKSRPVRDEAAITVRPQSPQTARPVSSERAQILERVEKLWGESIAGLEDSKAPVTINRPDGSSMKVPGDLRARAGFIRSAKDVLQLSAQLSGELQPMINADVVLVCDLVTVTRDHAMRLDAEEDAIDIGYTREID
jgi:hypothetical protein